MSFARCLVLFAVIISMPLTAAEGLSNSDRIQPWSENPSYWQYKGEPVMLIGGSDDDNLFQWPAEPLRFQLDRMQGVGGNYVRNTMSDRHDKGWELYPYLRLENGKYDLDQWNPEYWDRFARFLKWTAERGIIVQIEVWDRFDYSRNHWSPHPYNPVNNVNYTGVESGLAPEYPNHPGRNEQPFFFTTPEQRNNTLLLKCQQRFVDKLLAYSLDYGHVLYCMDNETGAEEEWGQYWARWIKEKARQKGVLVCVTEMWDNWDIKSETHRRTLDHGELYDFADVSQNNHNKGEEHWNNAAWVHAYLKDKPRPINTVKTYGADANKFGHSDQDAVERVWRHLLAGFASVRFHRPPSGLGLNPKAQATIISARGVESLVRFWNLKPRQDLLSGRHENEAYVAADPGKAYVLYFTAGGAVTLNTDPGEYGIRWVSVDTGAWGSDANMSGGQSKISAPGEGNWVAVISK